MNDRTLEQRIQRFEDIEAINQLMSRRAYFHSAGMHDLELEQCWVKETPEPTFEPEDWGMWVGLDSIQKAYAVDFALEDGAWKITFNQPYSVGAVPAVQPEPPTPYATFAETTSYADAPTHVRRRRTG